MSRHSRLILLALVAACGGEKHEQPPPPAPRDAAAPVAHKPSRAEEGGALFQTYCALCHGDQAQGYVADFAPSLVSPTFLATVSDTFLRTSIALGRPGTSMAPYGKNQGGPLSDDDILKMIGWIRSLHTIDRVHADAPGKGDAARGQAIYDKNCKECHGDPKARGQKVWLANPTFLEMASDPFLRYAIAFGRPGTEMPAWEGTLGAQAVDDLVALLRSWAPASAQVPERPGPPPPPTLEGDIVINPKGKAPDFHIKDDRFVPAAEVKKAMDEKRRMVIVDARAPSDWSMMHIPGAVSIPYYSMTEIDKLPKDGTFILTYCACPHHASGVVLDELRKRGWPADKTAIIDEGILFWQQQGYPIAVPDGAAAPPTPKLPGSNGKPVQ